MHAAGRRPRIVVLGARGRVGRGAVRLAEEVGADIERWGRKETQVRAFCRRCQR
jgi:hypothetical protein